MVFASRNRRGIVTVEELRASGFVNPSLDVSSPRGRALNDRLRAKRPNVSDVFLHRESSLSLDTLLLFDSAAAIGNTPNDYAFR